MINKRDFILRGSCFCDKYYGYAIKNGELFSAEVISYQLKLIKMRAILADLNDCAVPFLSRAAANMYWYHYKLFLSIC